MVLAYHVILGACGFWLPNDPRGSWSDFVWSWELRRFGPATKTNTRRSVAHVAHDGQWRMAAKGALKHPAVKFTGEQAVSIAAGFEEAAARGGYRIFARSILPEHVHLDLGRHHFEVEQMVRVLKQAATEQLVANCVHPFAGCAGRRGALPTVWQQKCWHVFLDGAPGVERAVRYVENNPVKEGCKRQRWSFVVPSNTVDLRSTAKQKIAEAVKRPLGHGSPSIMFSRGSQNRGLEA